MNDTKLDGVVDKTKGRTPLRRSDFNKLEKWADKKLRVQQSEMQSPVSGTEKHDVAVRSGN